MSILNTVGVLLTIFSVSQAWWVFGRNKERVDPQTDIDTDCLQLARNGSCAFYECLNRRFPCHHSFAIDHGKSYCQRFYDHLDQFDTRGREWVISSQRCLTESLSDKYRLSSTTCHDLNSDGWGQMSNCFLWEGFCSIAWDNKEALWRVFQGRGLFHSIRVWREILDLTSGCAGYNINRFVQWGMGKITGLSG